MLRAIGAAASVMVPPPVSRSNVRLRSRTMNTDILANNVPLPKSNVRFFRRLQVVFTAVFVCIGAGMIVGAWFSIGHIRGEGVVNLAMLGIILPVSIYGMLAVRVWRETIAGGGDPGRVARWCTRTRVNQAIPFFFLVLILTMANNLNHALDRTPAINASANDTSSDDSFDVGMRRECLSSGIASLGAAANGPQGALLHRRVQGYCDCVANRLEATYSMTVLNSMAGDHDRITHDPKVQGVIAACQREAAR